ncbi:DUF1043 family protein [Cardiobacteriaceae bacterium TAE3-ERU3]|nr:DUF1043 family protein [Cardiobacteriaceae bacterium TAE3-ERU3]
MNTEMDVVIAGLIGFVIGAVLMAIIGRGSKGKKDLETAKLQAEYDSYREKVNAHFAKTADAVDGLTKSYQQVFDHLSDGAQNLMDKKALQDQLEKRQGKAVTLAYLVDQESEPKSGAGKTKVSKVEASSVVSDGKQAIEPLLKKEAPVPADEKADVIAYANTVKTPADTAKPEAVKPVSEQKVKAETAVNAAPAKAQVNEEAKSTKSNVQKAAENAGLKPADTIVKSNQHESAIDSVKKHIKDDHNKGTKA